MAKPNKSPAPAAPKPVVPARPPAAPVGEPARPGELSYTRKVMIAVGISAAAILFSAFLFYIAHILVLCFAGMLLAVFLSAPSDLLAKHSGMKRMYALLIVLAALALIVFGGGYYMQRTIVDQVQQMAHTLPGAVKQVEKDLVKRLTPAPPPPLPTTNTSPTTTTSAPTESAPAQPVADHETENQAVVTPTRQSNSWLAAKLIEIREAATDFLFSESFVKRAGTVAGGVVSSTFGVIGDCVVVFGVGLFFAINPRLYSQGAVKLLPVSHRARTATVLHQVGTQLEWWFVGQLCSMASIALLTFVALKILGIQMAATLAILAGLLNFIPNFGPIIAAVPAVLIAFAPAGDSTQLRPALAGWTIVAYIIIQLLEGWVITPFFQQRAVEIPPALIILAQVIFALLLGPVGLVLATPILAAILVIIRMVYVEDLLGDHGSESRT